ncbi:ribosome biogenesis factor YjgA [Pseudomaricurvus sp. HS19]|uniref:ribosome biogenesis factor YjgA n=1 Tax=Pseudomaricurvus sp. HS19 TaxID=2692626 RepID=UPI00136D7FDC|nr:ribosome biogenesis factor YjgA [Pseudomaricurvus sp. HS19]MYM64626.1 DUF615 domain-containing protein [Pseudomaricurvus sp. HS19]
MSDFDDLNYDNHDDQPKSRTAIKKEMQALQDLGTQIVELSDKHIAMIPLHGRLGEAIHEARGMKHREARRRMLQYIGKQMRLAENLEEIQQAFERIQKLGQEHTHIQHLAEQWRDRLLSEGNDAVQEFVSQYSDADVQHLRQLLRNAQKEQKEQKPPATARKLFRYVRDLIMANY